MKKRFSITIYITILTLTLLKLTSCNKPEENQLTPIQAELSINEKNVMLMKTQTLDLTYTIKPDTANIKDLSWTSSNQNVATVSSSGIVTGVGVGNAIIKLSSSKRQISAQVDVLVNEINLRDVELGDSVITAYLNEPKNLPIQFIPANAANKTIQWQTSDNNVIQVDQSGNIIAKKLGYAFVTASRPNQSNIYDHVTVIPASRTQVAAAHFVNSNNVTENKYFWTIFLGALNYPVTLKEIKLYKTNGLTFIPGEEYKSLSKTMVIGENKAAEITKFELTSSQYNQLSFGSLVRIEASINNKNYYIYINMDKNIQIMEI